MRFFVSLFDPHNRGISGAERLAVEALPRKRGLTFEWHAAPHAAILTAWDDPYEKPSLATEGDFIAVGIVRLDNSEEVENRTTDRTAGGSDLQRVVRTLAVHGPKYIPLLLGDFAVVLWNSTTRAVLATTDALGVGRLFYAQRGELVALASRAEALALEDQYEPEYFAEIIALCQLTPELTPYKGVRRIPPGTIAEFGGTGARLSSYWSSDGFEPTRFRPSLERDAPEMLRQLLAESVRRRVSADGGTWSELSGGLDSSSIVSLCQWMLEKGEIVKGLAGTVTYVDSQGTDADEREYSTPVVARWRVRNETIIESPFWASDRGAPPHLDQPRPSLAFFARERQVCDIVRGAGGRVLLSGLGGDELFTGTTLFFADWLARGRLLDMVRELARWAAAGRVSFWQLALGNAVLPLVPREMRRPRSYNQGRLLPWISPAAARRYQLNRRTYSTTGDTGRLFHKYRDAVAAGIRALSTKLDAGLMGDSLDVRYPFLYRPLVEFALQLPPELCTRPHARKWVLRAATDGILPDVIRTRVGKGAPTDLLVRSLSLQRSLLEPLTRDSMLADLGLVDVAQLRAAFAAAPLASYGDRDLCADVQTTLVVEAWLRLRSGRWP